jgi:hypothetical protein
MTKKVVKNERLVCILVQANDVRRLLITQWESCKAQWVNIVFQLFRNLIMDVFPFFWRRRRFGKIEKFNALKAARPEVADRDTMEFAVEEETAS